MVSEDAALRFGMKPTMAPPGMMVRGVGGGTAAAKVARAQEFLFGGQPYKNVEFLVGGRMGSDGETIGLLGQNILGSMDIEYDLANGYLRFFRAVGCGSDANLAYWSAARSCHGCRSRAVRSGAHQGADGRADRWPCHHRQLGLRFAAVGAQRTGGAAGRRAPNL
jgi:hypothetical protein